MAINHINQNKYQIYSGVSQNLSFISSGKVDCIAENHIATINETKSISTMRGFEILNVYSFKIFTVFWWTFGSQYFTKSRFPIDTQAAISHMNWRFVDIHDKNHQKTGHNINQIPNIAQINAIFFVLFSSVEISEI